MARYSKRSHEKIQTKLQDISNEISPLEKNKKSKKNTKKKSNQDENFTDSDYNDNTYTI